MSEVSSVFDADKMSVTFHDPGLPARPSRIEKWEDFESAWEDPYLIALKLKAKS